MGESDSLVLVHAIFRHGDRTPVQSHRYPKSPNIDEDFYPYGPGQLTDVGRKTMFELGRILRKKYDEYLGNMYIPHKVDAQTSATDRSQTSLQLILAALFPPNGDQVIDNALNWQPIPYKYVPINDDKIIAAPLQRDFIKAYMENYRKTPMEQYSDFFSYFEEHTGLENVIPRNVWLTLGTFEAEEAWGFEVPAWVQPVYNRIKEITMLEYQLQTATKELKSLVVGGMFAKILNDTKAKIAGKSTCDLHLYSGHDFNVAHVLTVLGLMYPHLPRYASCVLLEVHKVLDSYRFKVIYRDSKKSEFKLMVFPNDDTSISLEEFEKVVIEFVSIDQ